MVCRLIAMQAGGMEKIRTSLARQGLVRSTDQHLEAATEPAPGLAHAATLPLRRRSSSSPAARQYASMCASNRGDSGLLMRRSGASET